MTIFKKEEITKENYQEWKKLHEGEEIEFTYIEGEGISYAIDKFGYYIVNPPVPSMFVDEPDE